VPDTARIRIMLGCMSVHLRSGSRGGVLSVKLAKLVLCCSLLCVAAARGGIVYQTFNYTWNTIWPTIDFDGDGQPELSFDSYAIGNESGGVIFFTVHSSTNSQLLLEGWRVLPLNWGDTISAVSPTEAWSGTDYGASVWTVPFYTSWPVVVWTPGEGVSTNPPPAPPPGEGVGMSGYGSFLGVRFLLNGGWRYGWVRLGALDGPVGFCSRILDYAYETDPDSPIITGSEVDSDHDGVCDLVDDCPGTPAGEIVDSSGCSISQLVPSTGSWKNHGEYVTAVAQVAGRFMREGLISEKERAAIVSGAARSGGGKNRDK
jgi:hypothetical protein